MADLRVVSYTTLVAAVMSWLNREDLDEQIPIFIQDAEAMMNRELRVREMLARDTIEPPYTDEGLENLPGDFLEMKQIRFLTNPEVFPEYVTPAVMAGIRAANPGMGSTPRRYTILGRQIQFDRTPQGGPSLEIMHYAMLPALSTARETNNVLLVAPDLYRYATLMSSAPFLKNDARLVTWTALYQQARDAMMAADKKGEKSSSTPLVPHTRRVF